MKPELSEARILSRHRFKRPGIRLWLPVTMLVVLLLCGGWLIAPRVRVLEFIALMALVYVATSALVAVCEITVLEEGLVVDRLLLPERFVPWDAVNRVLVYAHSSGNVESHVEITSISVHEGLSPLNRLPGLVYGQGFRQTIVITPDALEDYEVLMAALVANCRTVWHQPRG